MEEEDEKEVEVEEKEKVVEEEEVEEEEEEEVDDGEDEDVGGKSGKKVKLDTEDAEREGNNFVAGTARSGTDLLLGRGGAEKALSLVPVDSVVAANESQVHTAPSHGTSSHEVVSSSDGSPSEVEHRYFDTTQMKAQQGEGANRSRRKEGEEGGGGRGGVRGRKEREEGGGGNGEKGRVIEQRQKIEGDRIRRLKESEEENQENEKEKREERDKNFPRLHPLTPSTDVRSDDGAMEIGRDAADLSGPALKLVTEHLSLEIDEDSAQGKKERGRGRRRGGGSEEVTSCLLDEESVERERPLARSTVLSHTHPVDKEDSRRGKTIEFIHLESRDTKRCMIDSAVHLGP